MAKWTKEAPQKRGYYWWRSDDPTQEIRILSLSANGDWHQMNCEGDCFRSFWALDGPKISGEFWDDPILPPR